MRPRLLLVGLVALALLVTFSPGVARGPLGTVDPLYERTRLRHIGELSRYMRRHSIATARNVATGLSLVPFATPFAVLSARSRTSLITNGLHLLLVPAAIYFAFGVAQQRWLFPLNLTLIVPAALGVQWLMHAVAPAQNVCIWVWSPSCSSPVLVVTHRRRVVVAPARDRALRQH